MIEKKRVPLVLALAALLLAPGVAAAQSGGAARTVGGDGAMDVIVLLDASQSVLPWFQEATDYVVGPVARDFLRLGDTFHLLSFGASAQSEIAQRVDGERDVKSILARLYLLYPVERASDLIGALSYLGQYAADLPGARPKTIVIVTDGVHDPASGSPWFGLSEEASAAELRRFATDFRRNGWKVRIVRLPLSAERAAAEAGSGGRPAPPAIGGPAASGAAAGGASSAGAGGTADGSGTKVPAAVTGGAESGTGAAPPLLSGFAEALGEPLTDFTEEGKADIARRGLAAPELILPADLGERPYSFDLPIGIRNPGDRELALELDALLVDGTDLLDGSLFARIGPASEGTLKARLVLPATLEPGPRRLTVEPLFADGVRTVPQRGQVSLVLYRSPLRDFFRSGARIALFAIVLVLVAGALVLVLVLVRRTPRRAAAPLVEAVRRSATEREPADEAAKSGAATKAGPGTPASRTAATRTTVGEEARSAGASATVPLRGSPAATATPASAAFPAEASPSALPAAATPAPLPAKAGTKPAPASIASSRADSRAASPAASAAYAPRVSRPGSIRVELRVEEQNPHVGQRNVHLLQAGSSKTLGGGRSDFLVFLVPMPSHVAELHFDGERCAFVPLRRELFPSVGAIVEDCLGKEIEAVSPKGFPLRISFHRWEAPADRINRLLHCIEVPGLFSFDLD